MSPEYTPKVVVRFWSKVDIRGSDECWEWQANLHNGYGRFTILGEKFRSHRIAYELSVGNIPDDLCVLHSCDNPPCCNPAHLFLGTRTDNAADRDTKGRNGSAKGESHPAAKLTDALIFEIRKLHENGCSCRSIAKRFNVSKGLIEGIINHKRWKHV